MKAWHIITVYNANWNYNKLLAKLASDWRKPNGLFVIPPEKGLDFLSPLYVGKFHGVGPATVKKLSTLGIHTVLDLRNAARETLIAQFGKTGLWFYEIARGIDKRPVQPSRQRKSVGAERTFPQNINDPQVMLTHLQEMASQVSARLKTVGLAGRTISIKVRFSDFETITRAYTHAQAVWRKEDLIACLPDLLDKALPVESQPSVRLLGVSVSGMLCPEDSDKHTGQMDLLEDTLMESGDVRR